MNPKKQKKTKKTDFKNLALIIAKYNTEQQELKNLKLRIKRKQLSLDKKLKFIQNLAKVKFGFVLDNDLNKIDVVEESDNELGKK